MEQIVQTLPPPKEGEPWLLLRMRGRVHNQAGRFTEAEDCFRLVLKTDPANRGILSRPGESLTPGRSGLTSEKDAAGWRRFWGEFKTAWAG